MREAAALDRNWILITVGLVLLSFLTGCGKTDATVKGTPPPPEVSVVEIEPESIPVITELPGRGDAIRVSEIRPRATGILLHQLFKDGVERDRDRRDRRNAHRHVPRHLLRARLLRSHPWILSRKEEASRAGVRPS